MATQEPIAIEPTRARGGWRVYACLAVLLAGSLASASPSHAGSTDTAALTSDAVATAARRDATTMYEAFSRGDFVTFAHFTYPHLIDLMGGQERLVATLVKGLAEMKSQGFVVKSAKIDAPAQVVKAGPEIHALLPMEQVLAVPGGEMHSRTFLLGISIDKGQSWTFLDTNSLDKKNARDVVPNFNPALTLPAKPQPKFIKN